MKCRFIVIFYNCHQNTNFTFIVNIVSYKYILQHILWALMQYRIHVDISTSTRPICTKITGNTYQLISNHSHKFELNRISGRDEFDVDFVALNNNSLFDSTSSGPICTKITGNTYQLIPITHVHLN